MIARRTIAAVVAGVLAGAACGSDQRESVELPGLSGAPRDVEFELPTLPTMPPTTRAGPATESVAPSPATTEPEPGADPGSAESLPPTPPDAGEGDVDPLAGDAGDGGTDDPDTPGAADDGDTTEAPRDTAPESEPAPDVFLRRGDQGPAVESLQRRLIALEYLSAGGETGVFDDATADALIDFQAQYGLIVDGIFGPESDRALNAAAASVRADG